MAGFTELEQVVVAEFMKDPSKKIPNRVEPVDFLLLFERLHAEAYGRFLLDALVTQKPKREEAIRPGNHDLRDYPFGLPTNPMGGDHDRVDRGLSRRYGRERIEHEELTPKKEYPKKELLNEFLDNEEIHTGFTSEDRYNLGIDDNGVDLLYGGLRRVPRHYLHGGGVGANNPIYILGTDQPDLGLPGYISSYELDHGQNSEDKADGESD